MLREIAEPTVADRPVDVSRADGPGGDLGKEGLLNHSFMGARVGLSVLEGPVDFPQSPCSVRV